VNPISTGKTLDDEYMSKTQINTYRQLLHRQHNSCHEILCNEQDSIQFLNQADPLDDAAQKVENDLSTIRCSKVNGQASLIESSLRAIDEGSYGYCVTCGGEIGTKRLDANPTASECIECKTISEKMNR
jgi:RNA polymerase-binding transcription factor